MKLILFVKRFMKGVAAGLIGGVGVAIPVGVAAISAHAASTGELILNPGFWGLASGGLVYTLLFLGSLLEGED